MNCILIEPAELLDNRRVCLSGQRARHIREVLGKGIGDTVKVGRLNGPLGQACIQSIDGESMVLACEWGEVPPVPERELILALPRPKVLRRLWAQLAALGLRHVHLVNAQRVERFYFDSHVIESDTYRPLLLEGLQQAVDTHLPRVTVHRAFRPFVEDQLPDLPTKIMLDPGTGEALVPVRGPVLLAIGPEGGWNDFERELLATQGFSSKSLGSRILRSDTACVAALARISG